MRSEHRGSDVDPRGVGVRQSRCLGDFVVVGLEFGVFHDEKLRRGGNVSDDCGGGSNVPNQVSEHLILLGFGCRSHFLVSGF